MVLLQLPSVVELRNSTRYQNVPISGEFCHSRQPTYGEFDQMLIVTSGSISAPRSASRPLLCLAVSARFGSTPTR